MTYTAEYSAKLTAKLRRLGLYEATVKKHVTQVRICEQYGADFEPFEKFAEEVLGSPPQMRAEMLGLVKEPEDVAPRGPAMSYRQYDTPIVAEMTLGFSGRREKK